MASFGTNINGITMVVDVNTSISGNYPNIKCRVNFGVYFNAAYSQNLLQWSGATFYFDGTGFSLSVNGRGAGRYPSSGYACSGSKEYNFGSSYNFSKNINVSVAFGNFSSSGTLTASASIPSPSRYECGNPRNITYNSATIDYFLSNNNNYWRVYLWDNLSGKTWNVYPDTGNGTANLTGLNPETNYQITTKVVDRNGAVVYTGGVFATFKTLEDQLKLTLNVGGTLKIVKAFYNQGGKIKKVKKGFINQGGTIKRFKNAGSTTKSSLSNIVMMALNEAAEEEQYQVIQKNPYIEIFDDRNEYEYEYGLTYKYKDILYFCEDFAADNPTKSYGVKFKSRFTPNYLVDRKFKVVVE